LIISANFKSFKNREETRIYLEKLNNLIKNINNFEITVFPPATALQNKIGSISIGSQNIFPAQNGAFTGEICLEQLEEFDIKNVLIGHSERREILNENLEFIAKKFDFAIKNNLNITFCVGESREIRENDETLDFLKSQFNGIDFNYKNLIIAYEPIWAIGSGLTPTMAQIEETLHFLKNYTGKKIIYGGSVKLSNIEDILKLPSCDGVLVGGASLDVNNFAEIIKIAEKI